jgi:hypothetical protein
MSGRVFDSYGSGGTREPVVGSCEHCNEPSSSIKYVSYADSTSCISKPIAGSGMNQVEQSVSNASQ